MLVRPITIWAAILSAASLSSPLVPAHALTMKECSAKYKAAQTAGTLNGMKWNDFRKAECGPDAAAAAASAPAASAPAASAATSTSSAKSGSSARAAVPPTRGARDNVVYPSAVSQKYSNESAGRARMHTCLDQYNANKANGGNGGLKWIEKGGGYYSLCNKQLKG